MFLVVGVASIASGILWILVVGLVIKNEDRVLTRVSRVLSALAFVGVDVVLAYAYVARGDQDVIRYAAVFVQAFKIVAALAAILALNIEVKERRYDARNVFLRRYRGLRRKPRQRPTVRGTRRSTPPSSPGSGERTDGGDT